MVNFVYNYFYIDMHKNCLFYFQTFIWKMLYFSNMRIGIGEVMFTFESDL